MFDADYTDDLALLADTPAQVKSLLHSLEQAARGIGLYIDKTVFMCFDQDCAIFSLNSKPLKIVNQFRYLGISTTESVVNINIGNVWIAIDRLLTI